MPITMRIPTRRLSQKEFGGISFEVMRHVFTIHNEIGRLFVITAFDHPLDAFEVHAKRLLAHTDLQAIAWLNINMKLATFTTLEV
jgi:hypothetical protein